MPKIYRLTNVDTGKHRFFAQLSSAMEAGNKTLGYAYANPSKHPVDAFWKFSTAYFSDESRIGWQRNNDGVYLSIIPVEVEA